MATRVSLQDQVRGGVEQKVRKKRTALGDIGNVLPLPLPPPTRKGHGVSVKPITRPVTRNFRAQLNAHNNKKIGEQGVEHVNGVRKAALPLKKVQENKKVLLSKKSPTLTSFLTARSKEACGLTKKPNNLIVNIDEGSKEDELAVVEYVEGIFAFYKIAEDETRLRDYMGSQPDINEKMRSILVDWLIEVHYKFELRQESLYLTVNIIDRFLSMKVVPRKELQLVGIAAMLIACKYEEIWAPKVKDLVQISDNAYVREQVLRAEKAILGTLEWYLTVPTPYMFLNRYIKASVPSNSEMKNMVYFFAELGTVNYSTTIKYPPSLLAASSVYAARCTLKTSPPWTETLGHYTGYSENQLKECAKLLVSFHIAAPESRLQAVYKKFSKPDNGAVALKSPAKSLLASTS